MADYRLPMDADGVKYHGVVDEDGQYPGQVLYGLDKNGRLKPVNVDDEGNVLTQVTGSIVEKRLVAPGDSAINIAIGDEYVFDIISFDSMFYTFSGSTGNINMGLTIMVAEPYLYGENVGIGEFREVFELEGEGKRESSYFTQPERIENNNNKIVIKIKNTGQRTLQLTRFNIRGFNI